MNTQATSNDAVDATVIIPTFNGDKYLARVLDRLESQQFDGSIEVLVIDSGSTDGTLGIIAAHPSVRLHEIPNSEFNHGRTRNLGARMARGRVVAFLTQDAIPTTDRWLAELTAPLELPNVRGVVGRQVPRTSCFPLLKYEIEGLFRYQGADDGITLMMRGFSDGTGSGFDRLSFYSDVNAAAPRAFLVDELPYRDLPYAEDMAYGRDILMAGHAKAYAPRATVEHSNDMTLHEYGMRIFEETVALRRVGADLGVFSLGQQFVRSVYGILTDGVRIVLDDDYSPGQKLRWLFANPWYHISKWRSYRRASRIDLADEAGIAKRSLEATRAARTAERGR